MYVCIGALLLPCFTIEYWGLGFGRRCMCALAHFSSLLLSLSTGGLAWGGFSVHIGAPLLQPPLRLGGLSVHIGAPPPAILVLYFLWRDDNRSTIR
ncbi:hypothetical protein DEU56DRAFT_235975 [Suillus clintonianus]|uniref:uncharacterized protein n=1 Tax=Suillus clintonianus TaxID=1904413 RepID=UPI001B85CD9C|nr:uncharacterized protein DEU56DRAFT_235975 [Suillus clintonianus]KAG2144227.1 hypothetical protein DEU56DRAFT_235975 [Suillus clintonianus]